MEKVHNTTAKTTPYTVCVTDEHRHLCAPAKPVIPPPGGNGGLIPPGSLAVNECILRPHICGDGECIDKPDGYDCVCRPGYRSRGHPPRCEGKDVVWVLSSLGVVLQISMNARRVNVKMDAVRTHQAVLIVSVRKDLTYRLTETIVLTMMSAAK